MPSNVLQQNIAPILGIDLLGAEEQAVFLMDIGDLILESALLRLIADLNENQEAALSQYLETQPSPEILIDYLLTHHQNFSQILDEEVEAFKEEAIAVFGDKSELE